MSGGRPRKYATLEEHVLARLPHRDDGECWPWTGTVTAEGYGVFSYAGVQHRAHRAAYSLWVEEQDEWLDHLCHTESDDCPGGHSCQHRRCCNPAHLRPLSNVENVMAGMSAAAENARKNVCKRGHPFDAERITPAGNRGRKCMECQRMHTRNHRARKKE